MAVQTISAEHAAATLTSFDAIIDARSPTEFDDDHLPGAVNWPTLDDDERRIVGTEHKQVSAFDARKQGAVLIARRIADLLEAHTLDKPKSWRPLVYCWRGGKRSGTLAWFLDQIGFRTHSIDGGYKAFRVQVRDQLDALPAGLAFTVIAGKTGSGKTRMLQALLARGAQVLDLEHLAQHRGSILGALPGRPQPSQKRFEMQVWDALRGFTPERPVFVESESRKIGARQVPEALLARMRQHGQCIVLNLSDAARVQLLLHEYAFYTHDAPLFCRHLESLVEFQGRDTVSRWQTMADGGRWAEVFLDLMQLHYDPLYVRSMQRNFATTRSREMVLNDGNEASMASAAATMAP